MLHIYYGSDVGKVRSEALQKARDLCAEGAEVMHVTSHESSSELVRSTIGTTSLFHPHEVFVFDMLQEDEESFNALLESLPSLRDSINHFVLIEGSLTPTIVKKLTECGTDITVLREEETIAHNPFGLSDALLLRDKKQLWIRYQEGVRNGLSSEEMIGTLLWQLKVLRLVAKDLGPEESGLKPFVHGKAKRALSLFPEGDLTRLAHDLIHIYHRGHRGEAPLGDLLEAWILKL